MATRRQSGADLPLEVAHARFARVLADDRAQRRFVDFALLRLEARRRELARHEIALGDLEFFLLDVARNFDHLHAVAHGARNIVEEIRRADEQHLREVEGDSEVIVAESRILLRIEHFEERRRRVAVKAGSELVHLVEHQHGVSRAGLADRLDDVAGQARRYRCAGGRGFPPRHGRRQGSAARICARWCARCFGRARSCRRRAVHEAKDWALAVGVQFAHSEVFEDAPLDLFETVMVLVENAPRLGDVDALGA